MIRIRKQALHNLHKAQKRQKTYYDKLHLTDKLSYKVGTLVLVKNSKEDKKKSSRMEQNWSGPVYFIIEVLQKGTFRLARQDNLSKPLAQKYNMARLKLYHQRDEATTVNGVNGIENKFELLGDDATAIGDDYTSELQTDDATINVVSDRSSSNTSNCNTDKLPYDNWPSPSCEIITEKVFPFVEYQPVCEEWQRDRCCQSGLKLHHRNHRHSNKPSCVGHKHQR